MICKLRITLSNRYDKIEAKTHEDTVDKQDAITSSYVKMFKLLFKLNRKKKNDILKLACSI